MLSDLGHKYMGVFDEVVEGTNLLGQVPPLKGYALKHLRDILKPKRRLLWKGLLSDLGHKDMGVFDEVVEGTNLNRTSSPYRAIPSNL